MEAVRGFLLGFQLGMLPTMQRSMGMMVGQRSRLQVRVVHRIAEDILPILDTHMKTVHTSQGKRIQPERMGQQHCAVAEESAMHRTVEHTS